MCFSRILTALLEEPHIRRGFWERLFQFLYFMFLMIFEIPNQVVFQYFHLPNSYDKECSSWPTEMTHETYYIALYTLDKECHQIRRKLKKPLMENFIFCAVTDMRTLLSCDYVVHSFLIIWIYEQTFIWINPTRTGYNTSVTWQTRDFTFVS